MTTPRRRPPGRPRVKPLPPDGPSKHQRRQQHFLDYLIPLTLFEVNAYLASPECPKHRRRPELKSTSRAKTKRKLRLPGS